VASPECPPQSEILRRMHQKTGVFVRVYKNLTNIKEVFQVAREEEPVDHRGVLGVARDLHPAEEAEGGFHQIVDSCHVRRRGGRSSPHPSEWRPRPLSSPGWSKSSCPFLLAREADIEIRLLRFLGAGQPVAIYAGANDGVCASADAGVTWTYLHLPESGGVATAALAFDPVTGILYAASPSGLFALATR